MESTSPSVQTAFPTYLIEQIELLEGEKKEKVKAAFEFSRAFRRKLETDALQMARIRADQIDDSIYAYYGLQNKRQETPKRADLRTNGSTWVQMKFLPVPQELEEFVQTAPAFCTDSENGVVQTASTFMYYRGTEKTSGGVPGPGVIHKEQATAGGRASVGVVDQTPPEPPARPPVMGPDKTPTAPWHPQLREILKSLPLGTHLDEPMFQRIAAPLSEQLLPQFAAAAGSAQSIRKWAGYESIAHQVAARGPVIPSHKGCPKCGCDRLNKLGLCAACGRNPAMSGVA